MRWTTIRIAIGGGVVPAPGGDAERLTAGAATAAPPGIKLRADLFKELRNGELKAADARWPQRNTDLPLRELVRRMDHAAAALARTSGSE